MVSLPVLLTILASFSGKSLQKFQKEVTPACPPDQEICEFYFDVSYMESMVFYEPGVNYQMAKPVVVRNGTLVKRSTYLCTEFKALTEKEIDSLITADGSSKLLFVVNHQFPGTPIYVYSGQTVVVTVKNNLINEGLSVHWHGMRQLNTPWMDGASMVTQCPINAQESFQYRFKAEPEGTHWYHSHHGSQRTDGLAGPLVVLPKPDKMRQDIPGVDRDFVMMLSDWNRNHSSLEMGFLRYGNMLLYSNEYNSSTCYFPTHSPDTADVGTLPFHSALINGRGHFYPNNDDVPLIDALPLETFVVKGGEFYKFRIINAGLLFPLRVSIDKHLLTVIATDGFDIKPEVAESVIVANGERFDILVRADQRVDNYWIRAETLERYNFIQEIKPGKVLGILRYEGADNKHPTTKRNMCTGRRPCKVINCPFKQFAKEENIDCVYITELQSTADSLAKLPVPVNNTHDYVIEQFLNFHLAANGTDPVSTVINGRKFAFPSCPPQITYEPTAQVCFDDCQMHDCTNWCKCTHTIRVRDLDQAVQLVFINNDDLINGITHAVHVHGHSFHVVKIGFPEVDENTGAIVRAAEDIECRGRSCMNPDWSNKEWKYGNVPDLNLRNPPIKDTVIVPRKGYVVIRFYSDNPGYWYIHCHMETHNLEGMTLILKEGLHRLMSPPPKGMPLCGSFAFSNDEFERLRTWKPPPEEEAQKDSLLSAQQMPSSESEKDSKPNFNVSPTGVALFLTAMGLFGLIVIIAIVMRNKRFVTMNDKNVKGYGTCDIGFQR